MAPAMWECRYKKEKRNKRNDNIQKEKRTGISECNNKHHAIVVVNLKTLTRSKVLLFLMES